MKYTTETVTNKEQLDTLYNNSAFTIEGLAEKSIPGLMEWLEENTTFTTETPVFYIIKGSIMNVFYGLTRSNAYPDDLSIISVKDINLVKITLKRFEIGGRWFDDIVDNNLRREEQLKTKI